MPAKSESRCEDQKVGKSLLTRAAQGEQGGTRREDAPDGVHASWCQDDDTRVRVFAAIDAQTSVASIMLDGSATPRRAMSRAVP